MSWEVEKYDTAPGHLTIHRQGDGDGPTLDVQHIPDPKTLGYSEPTTHQVGITAGPDFPQHSAHMSWPTRQHGEHRAYLGRGKYGPPPSPELRTLIETHGANPAWMPLLDKLAEEYPDHFNGPVEEHTRQRFA